MKSSVLQVTPYFISLPLVLLMHEPPPLAILRESYINITTCRAPLGRVMSDGNSIKEVWRKKDPYEFPLAIHN